MKKVTVPVKVPMKGPVMKTASGNDHLVTLTASSDLYTSGCGEQGQLGRVPELFANRGGRKGLWKVYSLGRTEYGRLGLGQGQGAEEKSEPTPVEGLDGAQVACGASVNYAVTKQGSVYAWGMGTNLQLGMGEEDDEWSPVEMTVKQPENRIVLMVARGGQHTVLLVKDKEDSWSILRRGKGDLVGLYQRDLC